MTTQAINREIQKLATDLLNAISEKELKQNKKVRRQVDFLKKYIGPSLIDEEAIVRHRSSVEQMRNLFNFQILNMR